MVKSCFLANIGDQQVVLPTLRRGSLVNDALHAGVYKAGGPSVVDKPITLQSLTDRTNTSHTSNRPRMSI
jgi:hypothetical protein